MRSLLPFGLLGTALLAPAQCPTLGTFAAKGAAPTGLLPAGTATQISGMAASRHNPGVLWVHDDASALAQVVALRANGTLAQQYTIVGATNRDWEDVALGPGPVPGRAYLYLGDLGNNALSATTFTLWRVPEPDVPQTPGATIALGGVEAFRFHYPSGTFNAETLWIDPVDGAPYVLTKESSTTCRLFRYPLPLDASQDKALVLEATLTGMPTSFTGGAQSADGRQILARTQGTIAAWSRPAGTSFVSAFTRAPCTFASSQGQAEAISVAADGKSLWAISEGTGATLWNAPLGWVGGAPVAFAFGSGLAGSLGTPGLTSVLAPRLAGPALVLAAWQARAQAPALVLLSATGYDDGAVAFAGGWLHAAPDLALPLLVDTTGIGGLTIGVLPDDPALYGAPVSLQLFVGDPLAVQGIALSAGLRLVLDR